MAQVPWKENLRNKYSILYLDFALLIKNVNAGVTTNATSNAHYGGHELCLVGAHGRQFLKKDGIQPAGHQATAAHANDKRSSMRVIVEVDRATNQVLENWLGIWPHGSDVFVITNDAEYFEGVWQKRKELQDATAAQDHHQLKVAAIAKAAAARAARAVSSSTSPGSSMSAVPASAPSGLAAAALSPRPPMDFSKLFK